MLLQAYDFLELFDNLRVHASRSGGADQWGNITMGIELIRKVRRAESFGLTTPLVPQGRWHQVRQDRVRAVWLDPGARRRTSCTSSSSAPRTPWSAPTSATSPPWPHEEILDLDADGRPPRATRGPAGTGPRGLHPGPRSRGDRPGRAGRRGPLRRRRRRARRADPARRVRRRALDRLPAGRLDGERPAAGGPAGRDGPGGSKSQARTAVTQGGAYVNNPGRTTSDPRVTPATWWPAATWSCAGARRTTTWSDSPDGGPPPDRRRGRPGRRGGPLHWRP